MPLCFDVPSLNDVTYTMLDVGSMKGKNRSHSAWECISTTFECEAVLPALNFHQWPKPGDKISAIVNLQFVFCFPPHSDMSTTHKLRQIKPADKSIDVLRAVLVEVQGGNTTYHENMSRRKESEKGIVMSYTQVGLHSRKTAQSASDMATLLYCQFIWKSSCTFIS